MRLRLVLFDLRLNMLCGSARLQRTSIYLLLHLQYARTFCEQPTGFALFRLCTQRSPLLSLHDTGAQSLLQKGFNVCRNLL